jgi:hypothetical protein
MFGWARQSKLLVRKGGKGTGPGPFPIEKIEKIVVNPQSSPFFLFPSEIL